MIIIFFIITGIASLLLNIIGMVRLLNT